MVYVKLVSVNKKRFCLKDGKGRSLLHLLLFYNKKLTNNNAENGQNLKKQPGVLPY